MKMIIFDCIVQFTLHDFHSLTYNYSIKRDGNNDIFYVVVYHFIALFSYNFLFQTFP